VLGTWLPREPCMLFYKALIQPNVDYCIAVWGHFGVTLQDKLQNWQNIAEHPSCWLIVGNFGVENIDRQRNIHKAIEVIKRLFGLAPDYVASKFS